MELTLDQALQKGVEAHKAGNVQEADRYYTAILKSNPEHPDANHNMGVLAVGVGKLEEALPFFKTALEINQTIAQFWLSYIDALIKLNQIDDAKAVLDQAKSNGLHGERFDQIEKRLSTTGSENLNPVNPSQDKLQFLINLYTQRQFQKCLTEASDLLKDFPNSVNLYNFIGAANQGLRKLEEAVQAYQKALSLKPDYVDAYYNMGIALKEQGKLEEAIQAYQETLSLKPDYVDVLFNMGNALKEQGKLEEATGAYQKALSLKPDYPEAYNNMGVTLKNQRQLDDAIIAYNKALLIKPDYPDVYNNLGNALKEQEKLDDAIQAYQKALSLNPDYPDAYNNMGLALQEQGKLDDAIQAYNTTISIRPQHAETYYNLGNALKEQGKLDDAIQAYQKALSIKPEHAQAHNNMGITLKNQGKWDEAIISYNKALLIKPDYAQAYNNMGVTLKNQGKWDEAIIAYNKALLIKPDYDTVYYNLGNALTGVSFKKPNNDVQKNIALILDNQTYVRPKDIATAIISLLKFEPILEEQLKKNNPSDVMKEPFGFITELNKLPLLLKLMSICPLPDLEFENLLIALRASLLLNILDIKNALPELLKFQSSLALQCFTNEYVYECTKRDAKALLNLEKLIESTLSNGDQPSPQVILCLASFKALHEYDWSHKLQINPDIEEVFIRQIREPKEEENLKSKISVLDEITDDVSTKVREQYEENPYPRWVNLGLSYQPMEIVELVNKIELKLQNRDIIGVNSPDILIAGCGTGQHPIETASRFKGSKVFAVDLSLSSLAYAKRKTQEFNIENIEFMQADILNLKKLGKQFDIIESAGVLHHMDDPMAGWKVLTDCLKPGGLMRIGLYSELARQSIVKIKHEIRDLGIGSSEQKMKSFRKILKQSNEKHHKFIKESNDFYSISTLRDLLFHVQEHRFTIPQIKDYLEHLGLDFCGFESEKNVHTFCTLNPETDAVYNLDKWQAFEEANPTAFTGMYQFWCQKVG